MFRWLSDTVNGLGATFTSRAISPRVYEHSRLLSENILRDSSNTVISSSHRGGNPFDSFLHMTKL